MGFMIRTMEDTGKCSRAVTVDALEHVIPQTAIEQALDQEHRVCKRERKLNLIVTVWVIIALHLFPWLSCSAVFRKITRGLRFLWTDASIPLPGDSALSYRRDHVGVRSLVNVFKHVCRPIATSETQGAFLFGLRAMAIDGSIDDVPDTPDNAAYFGRFTTGPSASAFPQVQGVYLIECGTHCIVDAGFWPCRTSERRGGLRVVRSVTNGMLVMIDCGFHSYDMIVATRTRGAHLLGRLPAGVKPLACRPLADGSVLAELRPGDSARQRTEAPILVRVITYTITDPALPGYGDTHRLITTILNPRIAPAHEVVCAYHERWESELVFDEIETHQRLVGRTLRGLTPMRVLQELYGVLLAHYAIRFTMHEAAVAAEIDPDRLSFVHALEIVRDAIPEFQLVDPTQRMQLYQRMLHDIASKRLPPRRLRVNPREVKRPRSKFPRKKQEHTSAQQPSSTFAEAILIHKPPLLDMPPPENVEQLTGITEQQREGVLI